jgi:hypothetical protein
MHFYKRTFARFRPTLSLLESRALPSATAAILGSRLDINCDAAGSSVQIRDNGLGAVTATIKSASGTVTASGKGITSIDIIGGAGNDTIDFRTTGNLLTALNLEEDLGGGNNSSYTDLYDGIQAVPVNLTINTGAASDSVLMNFGTINNANVNVHANLGDGPDSFNAIMFNGASGNSKVNMNVSGQNGPDRVDYDMYGKIDAKATVNIAADNTVSTNDRLVVRYHGELDGALKVAANGAASLYGVQALFQLDAASTGTLTVTVTNGRTTEGSIAQVTDHTSGPKTTILDRLENFLTEMPGMRVTHFMPVAI